MGMKNETRSRTTPLFLCGMPGSGKSTVGRILAKKLDIPFTDLDKLIEQQAEQTIPEIFRTQGEAVFRELERKTLMQIPSDRPQIVALGGGALQSQQMVDAMKRKGVLIFIDASLSVLSGRLAGRTGRPMFLNASEDEIRSTVEKLLDERKKYYIQSHITVETGEQPAGSTADSIIQKIRSYES